MPAALMLEAAVAETVARGVAAGIAERAGRRREHRAGSVVADVEGLAGRVGGGIVRPRSQLVVAAVLGPGIAAAGGRDLKAEAFVGDDVDPGRRGAGAGVEGDDIFAAVAGEAAGAIEELQTLAGVGSLFGPDGWVQRSVVGDGTWRFGEAGCGLRRCARDRAAAAPADRRLCRGGPPRPPAPRPAAAPALPPGSGRRAAHVTAPRARSWPG